MDDKQYETCQKNGIFTERLYGIFVRPPTKESIKMIMEQIISHHLTIK